MDARSPSSLLVISGGPVFGSRAQRFANPPSPAVSSRDPRSRTFSTMWGDVYARQKRVDIVRGEVTIRLATQIGSNLPSADVLDEPSIGLPRRQPRPARHTGALRDLGTPFVVVETPRNHQARGLSGISVRAPGRRDVTFQGPPAALLQRAWVAHRFVSEGERSIQTPRTRRPVTAANRDPSGPRQQPQDIAVSIPSRVDDLHLRERIGTSTSPRHPVSSLARLLYVRPTTRPTARSRA